MATGEPVPISSLKHDPAWKHVQMFKNGDRVQLKCIYCLKLFSGGGIHRIKEHLACQKGNASCCSRVPSDVRRVMLQSLEGVVVKKKKKQNLADEIRSLTPTTNGVDSFGSPQSCDLNTGLELHHASPNMVEPISSGFTRRVDGMKSRSSDRRKRGRVENSSPSPVTPDTGAIVISNLATTTVEKDQVHMAVGRFLYDGGVPLDAVNSLCFQTMIDAISSKGLGLEATSYHDVRGWVLKNSLEEMNGVLDRHKVSWGRTGCSILVDEWTTETGRILINILVYCSEGTMFLKSLDVSDIIRSVDSLYELLKEVVEEVGVRNVLQVITDSAEHYVLVGKMLTETFRTLYWTPCAARSIDLMLEDFGKIDWINMTLDHAKSITRFIYNHATVLNRMRRYTGGKDLVQPTITRSVTDFISLKGMLSLKDNLHAMVNSQEWMDCPFAKKPDGIRMIDIIFSQSFWSSCITIIHITDPLVRVLRMVSSDKRPAMGYILAEMYHVKEAIKRVLVEKKNYMVFWNIIDNRWGQQLQPPLHEAGFFLNPKFYYNLEGDVHDKIPSGMLDCIERLVPDIKVQDKINKELISYKNAVGDFGRKMAIRARHTLLPGKSISITSELVYVHFVFILLYFRSSL